MSENLFRKVALDRLSSPEQLDRLLKVAPAHLWVSLVALGGLVALTVAWGVAGTLQSRVNGTGVLLRPGGVDNVTLGVSGRVTGVFIDVGDMIEEGQVIGRIEMAELVDAFEEARDRVDDLRDEEREARALASLEASAESALRARRRDEVETEIRSAHARVSWLDERIRSQRALLDDGLTTDQAVEDTRLEVVATHERLERLETELQGLQAQALQDDAQRARALSQLELQIGDAERQQRRHRAQLDRAVDVVAARSGRVIEIVADVGDVVSPGSSFARLDREGEVGADLIAIVYVPHDVGKKVQPGMPVQISPSLFNREEFGGIIGTVERVSDYPATQEGMLRTLSNPNLVQLLTAETSTPYEVRIRLEPDAATPSGYLWSTSRGPEATLQSGTTATAAIAVHERRPITLVLPALRRWLGTS